MGLGRIAASAVIVGAGVTLAGCVAQTPAPVTGISPAVAVAAPAANWQWTDAPGGPTVTLTTTDVTPAASSGTRTASLGLVCRDAVPTVLVAWDAPVVPSGQSALTYRFDNQPSYDVSTRSADPRTQIIDDPILVSQFIDRAAASHQLVLREASPAATAAATVATFSTTDTASNLTRFRTVCPDGTN